MPRSVRELGELLRETLIEWWRDDALRLGAALAYYTIFSLAPLLVIAIAVAGFVFGEEAAQGRVLEQLRGLMGPEGAEAVQRMIERASLRRDSGLGATALALFTMLLGASGAFGQLQAALNKMWDAPQGAPARKARAAGVRGFVRKRVLSFGMVLLIGLLLLVSLLVAAAVSALDAVLVQHVVWLQPLFGVLQFLLSGGVATLLFAAVYKILPDRDDIGWRDVWMGAVFTAVLFEVGKAAIGLYLGNAGIGSAYGAAGSLVIVLVWVYYSSQILFLGAEFTQVWARRRGSGAQQALA
jgi:membrane protein